MKSVYNNLTYCIYLLYWKSFNFDIEWINYNFCT